MNEIYRYILLLALIAAPEVAFSQQPQETVPRKMQSAPATVGANAQTPGAQPNPQRPRRRRTIENREFDDREKIILLLNAHCDFPSRDDLLSTSPNAEKHLQSIVDDDSVLLSVRMRAVQALSYFATPMNRETLEKILAHPELAEHRLMVIQAIRAYAIIAPDQAPAAIEPFLSHPTDFYRFMAISSLKNCPGQAAIDVLKRRYEVETNRYFQMRLKDAIDNHCKGDACR
jgi:hypothetical protein